jgi:hypothetical protein
MALQDSEQTWSFPPDNSGRLMKPLWASVSHLLRANSNPCCLHHKFCEGQMSNKVEGGRPWSSHECSRWPLLKGLPTCYYEIKVQETKQTDHSPPRSPALVQDLLLQGVLVRSGHTASPTVLVIYLSLPLQPGSTCRPLGEVLSQRQTGLVTG